MKIHALESFGAADGPGIRFVCFLQGCAMRCAFCHNPDSWDMAGGVEMSPAEVLRRALRYRAYWGEEGGLTASGGEPLLQLSELTELFSLCKASGVNTCLDTSLQPFCDDKKWMEQFDRLLENTDLVLLDIKHLDPIAHTQLTGFGNSSVLAGTLELSRRNTPVILRHVLIPGVTDQECHLRSLGEFARSLSNLRKIELLPYHTMAKEKYRRLGLPEPLPNIPPATEQDLRRAYAIISG